MINSLIMKMYYFKYCDLFYLLEKMIYLFEIIMSQVNLSYNRLFELLELQLELQIIHRVNLIFCHL